MIACRHLCISATLVGLTFGVERPGLVAAEGTAATSDRDYSAASGTLTCSPGERTKTITVNVRGDRKRESDEDFYVDLFSPSSNASIGQSRGTGTIVNDD